MSYSRFILKPAIFALLSLVLLTRAEAFDPFELQIYGYQTQGKGNLDLELLSSYIVAEHKAGNGGISPTYASQSMMRFAEAGELSIDIGWYAEVEWWSSKFNDDQVEGEFMLNLQKPL